MKKYQKNKKRLGTREIGLITTLIGVIIMYFNFAYFADRPQIFALVNLIAGGVAVGLPVIMLYKHYSKVKKIESLFPIFLHDVTENVKAGMTLPQAIKATTSNDYGLLTPYVKEISAKISWGIPLDKVLMEVADSLNSSSMRRTVQTINEAHRSGGKIHTVLTSVSKALQELERIKRERSSSVYSQMINSYVIFFIFLGVMIGLSTFLIPAFRFEETQSEIGNVLPEIFFWIIIIQGVFAGLAVGKMAEGSIIAGAKHSFVLTIIGYTVFTFVG
jgi:flagellar protein FlaJ